MRGRLARLFVPVTMLAGACGPADNVDVQPLPSLTPPSLEARVGLPEISGMWRFAGWELAPGDTASLQGALPAFGTIRIQTQKRDSLAGSYVADGASAPLTGELRRDSVVSLVTFLAPGDIRFLTGRIWRDTLWLDLSSLTPPSAWPHDARAAFVRTAVTTTFARVHGAPPPLIPFDSTAEELRTLPSGQPDSASREAVPSPQNQRPSALPRRNPPPAGAVDTASVPSPAPNPAQVPRDSSTQPERPEPQIEVPPPDVPLLGVPVG